MTPKNDDASAMLNWIREDLRDGFREIRDDIKDDLREVREQIGKDIEKHAKACAGARGVLASIAPGSRASFRVPGWVRVVAPVALAAALGLIGLGAYMGSGGDADATARAIRAMSDTIDKVSRDVEAVKAAAPEDVDTDSEKEPR